MSLSSAERIPLLTSESNGVFNFNLFVLFCMERSMEKEKSIPSRTHSISPFMLFDGFLEVQGISFICDLFFSLLLIPRNISNLKWFPFALDVYGLASRTFFSIYSVDFVREFFDDVIQFFAWAVAEHWTVWTQWDDNVI